MALPIRDGNQSLTTLSTIFLSNAHVPAHTVVSLGSQAITDIATAVSGVELGPNTLNALENITVTLGQVTITGGLTDAQLRASPVTIGGSVTANISGIPSVTFGTAVITGSTSILNFPSTQTVTFTQASITFGTAVITGSTSIIGTSSVTFTQASVTFGTAVITGSTSIIGTPSVTFGQIATHGVTLTSTTVTVSSIPAISGSVTANLDSNSFINAVIANNANGDPFAVLVTNEVGAIANNNPLSIAGTVTANVFGKLAGTGAVQAIPVEAFDDANSAYVIPAAIYTSAGAVQDTNPLPISGTVTANLPYSSTNPLAITPWNDENQLIGADVPVMIGSVVTIGGNSQQVFLNVTTVGSLIIAGTVTVGSCVTHGVTIANSSVTVGLASTTVTVSALPAISGTVTIGALASTVTMPVRLFAEAEGGPTSGQDTLLNCDSSGQLLVNMKISGSSVIGYDGNAYVQVKQTSGSSVTIGNTVTISGSVTASISNATTSSPLYVANRNAVANRTASSFTSTSSAAVLASNAARNGFFIANYEASGGAILYLRFASAAASTSSFDVRLLGGESYQMTNGVIYTGEIRGIYSTTVSGSGGKVMEF